MSETTINKKDLTSRLQLIWRLQQAVWEKNQHLGKNQLMTFLQAIAFNGIQIIFETRYEGMRQINRHIDHVLQQWLELSEDCFNKLNHHVHAIDNSGLPITLTFGKRELAIVTEIEKLADKLILIDEKLQVPGGSDDKPAIQESDLPGSPET